MARSLAGRDWRRCARSASAGSRRRACSGRGRDWSGARGTGGVSASRTGRAPGWPVPLGPIGLRERGEHRAGARSPRPPGPRSAPLQPADLRMSDASRSGTPIRRLFLLAGVLIVVAIAALQSGRRASRRGGSSRRSFSPRLGGSHRSHPAELRLPRVILGALAGRRWPGGTPLQSVLQNPMAGPYVVGVSSGAGLAAVAAMTLGLTFRRGPFDLVAVAAFAGGIGSVALVYALARRVRFLQSEGLLLIGIAVGAVFSALTSVFLVFSREGIQAALMWMLGTFSAAEWSKVWALLGALVVGAQDRSGSDATSTSLLWETTWRKASAARFARYGDDPHPSSLLAASSVAACGVVGFVGLMVPHLARGFLRTADHRYVLPGSALLGAVLTVAADTLARTVAAPLELPVGAVTSALGAPFLVWLVVRRHREDGGIGSTRLSLGTSPHRTDRRPRYHVVQRLHRRDVNAAGRKLRNAVISISTTLRSPRTSARPGSNRLPSRSVTLSPNASLPRDACSAEPSINPK